MMSEALGRVYNVIQPANGVYINLVDAGGVSFSVFEVDGATSSVITFAATAAGAGAVTPAVVDHYYGRSADQGNGVWHQTAVSPASATVVDADVVDDQIVIEILAAQCPDGKPWVKCTSDGAATVTAILHDLKYGRNPTNLRSVTA